MKVFFLFYLLLLSNEIIFHRSHWLKAISDSAYLTGSLLATAFWALLLTLLWKAAVRVYRELRQNARWIKQHRALDVKPYPAPRKYLFRLIVGLFFAFAPVTLDWFIKEYALLVMVLGGIYVVVILFFLIGSLIARGDYTRVTAEEDRLACWEIINSDWDELWKMTFARRLRGRTTLFYILAALIVVVLGIPMVIEGVWLTGLGIVILLVGSLWLLMFWYPSWRRRLKGHELFISRYGVYFNEKLFAWPDDAEFTKVEYHPEPSRIEIGYRVRTANYRTYSEEIALPVPTEHEAEAQTIVAALSTRVK